MHMHARGPLNTKVVKRTINAVDLDEYYWTGVVSKAIDPAGLTGVQDRLEDVTSEVHCIHVSSLPKFSPAQRPADSFPTQVVNCTSIRNGQSSQFQDRMVLFFVPRNLSIELKYEDEAAKLVKHWLLRIGDNVLAISNVHIPNIRVAA